jgi:hypothetical protein
MTTSKVLEFGVGVLGLVTWLLGMLASINNLVAFIPSSTSSGEALALLVGGWALFRTVYSARAA